MRMILDKIIIKLQLNLVKFAKRVAQECYNAVAEKENVKKENGFLQKYFFVFFVAPSSSYFKLFALPLKNNFQDNTDALNSGKKLCLVKTLKRKNMANT